MIRIVMCCFLLITLILGFYQSSSAATITVGTSGADYTTLTQAISMATTNDTIQVWDGTYIEPARVIVNKPLTIIGASSGAPSSVIFNCPTAEGLTATAGCIILITSSNVTIQKISVVGDSNLDGTKTETGIRVDRPTNSIVGNVTIDNCIITECSLWGAFIRHTYDSFLLSSTITNIYGDNLTASNAKPRAIQINNASINSNCFPSLISANYISNCTIGVDVNWYGRANVRNNIIKDNYGGYLITSPDNYIGITYANYVEGTITGNTLTNVRRGIDVKNNSPKPANYQLNGNIYISNNYMEANYVGIYHLNDMGLTGTVGIIHITSNTIQLSLSSNEPDTVGYKTMVASSSYSTPMARISDTIFNGFLYGINLDKDGSGYFTTDVSVTNCQFKNYICISSPSASNSFTNNYYSNSNLAGSNMVDADDNNILDNSANFNVNWQHGTYPSIVDPSAQAVLVVNNNQGILNGTIIDLGASSKSLGTLSFQFENNDISPTESTNNYLSFALLLSIPLIIFIVLKLKRRITKFFLCSFILFFVFIIGCFGGGDADFLHFSFETTTTYTSSILISSQSTITSNNSTTTSTIASSTMISPAFLFSGTISVSNRAKYLINGVTLSCSSLTHVLTPSSVIQCIDITNFMCTPIQILPETTQTLSYTFYTTYSDALDGTYSSIWNVVATEGSHTSLMDSFNFYIGITK